MLYKNLKFYAKKYGISVLSGGKPKSVNALAIDIFNYETSNKIKGGLYKL